MPINVTELVELSGQAAKAWAAYSAELNALLALLHDMTVPVDKIADAVLRWRDAWIELEALQFQLDHRLGNNRTLRAPADTIQHSE